jgi:hypothetical protein
LREWLRDLAQSAIRADTRPLRLLLLERVAVADEGWLESLCRGGHSEAGVPELFDPLEPRRLDPLDTVEKRRAVLGKMIEAVAALTGGKSSKLPMPGENLRFDRQLEGAVWEDPLNLMMASLLSVQSDLLEVLELPRTELAMRAVDREIKRLTEGAPSPAAERLLVHLAAFASLGNGLSHELALDVAEQESNALKLDYPGGPGALVSRVHEALPGPDHGLAPLVRDTLAEALVLRALGHCSATQQDAAMRRAVRVLGARVVPFVIRTVQDFSPTGQIAPLNWLETLIKAGSTDDLGLLSEIESALPHKTLVLREKAAEVDELLAERCSQLAKENPDESILSEQSRFLNNLANRLGNLGRWEEALQKAQEAVRIDELLAKVRPNEFRSNLSGSLHTLSIGLSELGRH